MLLSLDRTRSHVRGIPIHNAVLIDLKDEYIRFNLAGLGCRNTYGDDTDLLQHFQLLVIPDSKHLSDESILPSIKLDPRNRSDKTLLSGETKHTTEC